MATEGQSVAPAPAPVAAGQRSHRLRNLLLIVSAFVVLLGVAAAGTLLYFYDKATAIDRSTPQVVTQQFLTAALIDKDPKRVELFICDSWSTEGALAATAPPTTAEVSINWGDFRTTVNGDSAVIVLNMQYAASSGGTYHRLSETWTLNLAHQDGWRVCGMTKQASTPPTTG